jgi:hypothetical protein
MAPQGESTQTTQAAPKCILAPRGSGQSAKQLDKPASRWTRRRADWLNLTQFDPLLPESFHV